MQGKIPMKLIHSMSVIMAILITCMVVFILPDVVHAGEKQSNGKTSQLGDYDYSTINSSLDDTTYSTIDFEQLVKEIIEGDGSKSVNNFGTQLKSILFSELVSNKKALIQIVMLAIISALFSNFASAFYNPQISETGYLIISIALFTMLTAIFSVAVTITTTTLDAMIAFLKALIPTYFAAVAFSSGSLTSAAFYEIIFVIIMIINSLFKTVLVTGCWMYVLISMADCMSKEERMSKLAELIKIIVTWTVRTVIIIITGLNSIQGIVLPMTDSVKSGLLVKALKLIPGIGNGAATLSSTVIGAGTLIKNGIGAAAMIVITAIAIVPIIKLVIFVLSYKFVAALVQPISDKRIVKCINSAAEGVNMLLTITVATLIMFLITIAVICATTNMAYMIN